MFAVHKGTKAMYEVLKSYDKLSTKPIWQNGKTHLCLMLNIYKLTILSHKNQIVNPG
jgi:hypothetical protein